MNRLGATMPTHLAELLEVECTKNEKEDSA